MRSSMSRRTLLGVLSSAAAGLVVGGRAARVAADASQGMVPIPGVTGPGPNPYWNSVGPFVTYPEKLPLIRMTDRAIQLETPRPYFLTPFTSNHAFYVRFHLELIPN